MKDLVEWQPDAPGHYKVEVSYGGEEVSLKYLLIAYCGFKFKMKLTSPQIELLTKVRKNELLCN